MNPDLLFDVRLLERNVTRGRLTAAEVAQHLKSLPDAAANAANLEEALEDRGVDEASEAKPAPAKKTGK